MSMPAILTIALLLDALLGEPRRWHPLVGFGNGARFLEKWLHRGARTNNAVTQLCGLAALFVAIAPPVALCVLLSRQPISGPLVEAIVLYLALGHRSLRDHSLCVFEALRASNLEEARRQVGRIVSRDTEDMNATRVAGAAVESVLENGNDALFGTVFWFALLGAPGALIHRLVNTLDAMWGYRTPRYWQFGRAAARLDDVLNFIPARLTALSYALCGDTAAALRSWKSQAPTWDSPNAGPVMAAGAGALGVQLGGGAFYHGSWRERSRLGEGRAPDADDIRRSLTLLLRALGVWIAALWLIAAVTWVRSHA